MMPAIVLASCLVFQVVKTPDAPTPSDAPLPSKGTVSPKAVDSELVGSVKEDGVMSFSRYEAGSFALKPARTTSYVNHNEVVLIQGKQRFAIKVKDVAEIVEGTGAGTRVNKSTENAVPAIAAKESGKTLVGIVWSSDGKKSGVVLKLDKGDFEQFISALESVTGLTTIDSGR